MNLVFVYSISLSILSLDLLILFLLFLRAILPRVFHGAFYAPSQPARIEKMFRLLEIKPGDKAVDLGSGDGRLVIALAQAGIEAHGYEIDPLLVWQSRRKIKQAGLQDKAFIHLQSFWPEDLSQFNIVVVYALDFVMRDLEKKLKKELKPGARIVSNYFPFPHWPEIKREGEIRLYQQS